MVFETLFPHIFFSIHMYINITRFGLIKFRLSFVIPAKIKEQYKSE
jgi:hypothetical protein